MHELTAALTTTSCAFFCSQLKEGEDTTSTTGLKSWEHSYQSQMTRKLPGRAVALYFTAQGCNGHYNFTTDSSLSSQIRRTFELYFKSLLQLLIGSSRAVSSFWAQIMDDEGRVKCELAGCTTWIKHWSTTEIERRAERQSTGHLLQLNFASGLNAGLALPSPY